MGELVYWIVSAVWGLVGFGFGYYFGRNTVDIERLVEKEEEQEWLNG